MGVTGFSISVLAPVSETFTFNGGSVVVVESRVVVVVASEKMGGSNGFVEIGIVMTDGGGATVEIG